LVLLGAALGAALVWRLYAPLIAAAHAREADATNRLVQAWREGYTVPTAEAPEVAGPVPDALDGAVLEFIEQFDAAGAAVYAAKARRIKAENPDMASGEVVRRLERERVRVNVLDEPYMGTGAVS
jgi:hypothetical protein